MQELVFLVVKMVDEKNNDFFLDKIHSLLIMKAFQNDSWK
jgi:hypothetical protein